MNIQLGETRKTSENEAKRKGEPTDLKKLEALANANKLRFNENAKAIIFRNSKILPMWKKWKMLRMIIPSIGEDREKPF